MSMSWPLHFAYSDPALAATLLASLPHMSYHHPAIPTATTHLAPSATPYPPNYYPRYTYASPVAALHRSQARNVNPYPMLHPHPPMSSLNILGMPSIASSTFPPVSNPGPSSTSSYHRSTLLNENLSPVNSDTSSECDYNGANSRLHSPSHHPAQTTLHPHPHHSHHAHRVNVPVPVTSATLLPRDRLHSSEQPQQLRLNGMSVPVVAVLPFENNVTTSYNHVVIPSTSGISSSSPPLSLNKPEQEQGQQQQQQSQQQQQPQQPPQPQPKLFQPYKNDTPEDKPDRNGTM